ncbi:hypothetical protein DACRYDRAFT_25170 [Dacryopinax primogenitus]|uniref:Uncharacterized protein n=1 Tax=Dacryopinax primogenitus (strain DJM 731) TaxID=1858805 RepID=M5G0V8_DACPD|nr:uncharacterized protein DACRYDRAFT_25170 [Dacryopinax primogenitus]EJT97422.1 hypothetical protein DACRYDRAFT_25170 [Dacryopinax primogenitus]
MTSSSTADDNSWTMKAEKKLVRSRRQFGSYQNTGESRFLQCDKRCLGESGSASACLVVDTEECIQTQQGNAQKSYRSS